MELTAALQEIEDYKGYLPYEAFAAIRGNKEQAIPELLNFVNPKRQSFGELVKRCFYAMYLLAEFKEKKAFRHLVRYLYFSGDQIDGLLGDSLTENFQRVLASVAARDNIAELEAVVKDKSYIYLREVARWTRLSYCI
jgi:hypothetical protein